MDLTVVVGMISRGMISISFFFLWAACIPLKSEKKYLIKKQNRTQKIPEPCVCSYFWPWRDTLDFCSYASCLCIFIMENCFRICSFHKIRFAIIITILFASEIEFSGPGKAGTWLQNQLHTASLDHQKPGGGIPPVATQSSGQPPCWEDRIHP